METEVGRPIALCVEDEIVLLCSRRALDLSQMQLLHVLLGRQPQWGRIIEVAIFNKVILLVAKHLMNMPYALIPAMIRRMLAFMYLGNQRRNDILLQELRRIIQALRGRGIEFSPLKGTYLIPNVYFDGGTRSSNDLDILIAFDTIDMVSRAMHDLGYTMGTFQDETSTIIPASRAEDLYWKATIGNLCPFLLKHDDPAVRFVSVDFSFDVDPIAKNDSAAATMLRNLRDVDLVGVRSPLLTEEDFLIHVCAHLYKEARTEVYQQSYQQFNLIKFCDVRELLLHEWHAATPAQWGKLADRAQELNLYHALRYSLACVTQLYNEPVWGQVIPGIAEADNAASPPSPTSAAFWLQMFPQVADNATSVLDVAPSAGEH